MIKNLAQVTFQRATVGTDNDELNLTLNRMRSQLNEMRQYLREMHKEIAQLRAETHEIAALRAEVAALRAGGVVVAAPSAPVAPRPIQVPQAVLDAAEAAAEPTPAQVEATPTQAAPADVAPIVAPAPQAPAAAPAPAAPARSSIAASVAAEAAGQAPAPVSDLNPDGINHAPDGTAFWGLINNESARARAAGKVLIIDQPECISCGTCVEQTDSVFVLPDDSKAVARKQEGPMDAIQDAIEACPVTCIHWTDDPNKFPPLNDEHGVKA